MAEPKLVILSVPVQNEKRYEFDVLAAVKDTVDGLTILDPKKNSGAILFGQLAPFYTRLKNELMDHIVGNCTGMNPEIWMVVQGKNIHFHPIAKIGGNL